MRLTGSLLLLCKLSLAPPSALRAGEAILPSFSDPLCCSSPLVASSPLRGVGAGSGTASGGGASTPPTAAAAAAAVAVATVVWWWCGGILA